MIGIGRSQNPYTQRNFILRKTFFDKTEEFLFHQKQVKNQVMSLDLRTINKKSEQI